MKKLITGLEAFRANYVSTHRDLLEQLSHGQKPRVLFITCSDSRIDPNLLTQTDVGELFVIRNAGNIVPPYGAANGGEGATIEYAIHALGIEQIVVCGHSHCGAMKGLLQLGKLAEQMPLVYDWLKHAEATRRLINENYSSHHSNEQLLEIAIAENVVTQIENLKTYPVVHSRLYQGKLKIYGWVYMIETGEVFAYDPESHSYIAPQSQLPESEGGKSSTSRQYVTTYAPPVACELPYALPEIDSPQRITAPAAASYSSHSNSHSSASSSNGNSTSDQDGLTPLWLSPEQAARIYRGTSSQR